MVNYQCRSSSADTKLTIRTVISELSFSRLCDPRQVTYFCPHVIFYFPWHRHQTEGTMPTAFGVSSERHRKSMVNWIAKVATRLYQDPNPEPLGRLYVLTTELPCATLVEIPAESQLTPLIINMYIYNWRRSRDGKVFVCSGVTLASFSSLWPAFTLCT